MDLLSKLLSRYTFSASVFYNGEFCGSNDFNDDKQLGQLHLVQHGFVSLLHEHRPPIHIEKPSLAFYPRALNHRLFVPPGSPARLLCANILFEGEQKSLLAKALPDCLIVPLEELNAVTHTLAMLFQEANEEQSGQRMVMDRLCDVLVVQMLRHAFRTGQLDEPSLAGFSDPVLSPALAAIHDAPGKPWTIDTLAGLCHTSRSRFAKYFHDVVGLPPGDYITDRRMELAQKLLRSNRSVQSVALAVGYASQPAFSKAFTARVGESPRAWLNRLHGG